jgi:biopolymer transport protein ExbD
MSGVFGGRGGGFGGGGGGGGGGVELNLTALMDILSNLLFFLLASYTAAAVEAEGKDNMKLPSSTSQAALTPQLTIQISQDRIDVSGVPVANLDHGKLTGESAGGGLIPPLYERLKTIKESRNLAGRGDLAGQDLVLVLADKRTDSQTITSVLKTSGQAQFYNVKFGVIAR